MSLENDDLGHKETMERTWMTAYASIASVGEKSLDKTCCVFWPTDDVEMLLAATVTDYSRCDDAIVCRPLEHGRLMRKR